MAHLKTLLKTYFCFLTSVDEQKSGLENAPELRPAFESSPDLQPVGKDDDGLVLEGGQQLALDPLLLLCVALALRLVGLLAIDACRPTSLKSKILFKTTFSTDLTLELEFSVTRCAEISPLWQKLKKSLPNVCWVSKCLANFSPTLVNFETFLLQIFIVVNGQILKNNLANWSH